jgi:hypothetical protein
MQNFNQYISGGVALISSAFILSNTLFVLPTQAASLNGTINLSGASKYAESPQGFPATDQLQFVTSEVDPTTTGSFTSLIGTQPVLSDINLTKVGPAISIGSFNYTAVAINPLIQFTNGLDFDVKNPFNVVISNLGSGFTLALGNPFVGVFYNHGQAVGEGVLSVIANSTNGSYAATIATVPEPSPILGSTLILGFAPFLLRGRTRKPKQL